MWLWHSSWFSESMPLASAVDSFSFFSSSVQLPFLFVLLKKKNIISRSLLGLHHGAEWRLPAWMHPCAQPLAMSGLFISNKCTPANHRVWMWFFHNLDTFGVWWVSDTFRTERKLLKKIFPVRQRKERAPFHGLNVFHFPPFSSLYSTFIIIIFLSLSFFSLCPSVLWFLIFLSISAHYTE